MTHRCVPSRDAKRKFVHGRRSIWKSWFGIHLPQGRRLAHRKCGQWARCQWAYLQRLARWTWKSTSWTSCPQMSLKMCARKSIVQFASQACKRNLLMRERVDVPGGYFMWSQARRTINAHCLCDGHGGARHCKWDRTVKAGDRPLGREVAWLQLGTCDDACGTRQEHIDLKRDVGKAHYRAMRQAGRDRALHLAATCLTWLL